MSVAELSRETMGEVNHYPVMHREVLEFLEVTNKKVIVDCTVGIGSHALRLLETMKKDALLIGIDKDEESLAIASRRLTAYAGQFILVKGDFSRIDGILRDLNIKGPDAFLFDLGISTYQLNREERGFSFLREGPLDMRMDKNSFLCAYDLLNNLSEAELINIFRKFGEERYANRVVRYLVAERKGEPIFTTTQLVHIILRALPLKSRGHRTHPATRIFQALRIAVNRELEALAGGLEKAIGLLNEKGRLAVISFHSLEDRIAKHTFKEFTSKSVVKTLTKKPLIPTQEEINENAASRSAKLRVIEKIHLCSSG